MTLSHLGGGALGVFQAIALVGCIAHGGQTTPVSQKSRPEKFNASEHERNVQEVKRLTAQGVASAAAFEIDDAATHFKQAIALAEWGLGKESFALVEPLLGLAATLRTACRLEESAPLMERAERLGRNTELAASVVTELAVRSEFAGEWVGALHSRREAVDTCLSRQLGREPRYAAFSECWQYSVAAAKTAQQLGQFRESSALLEASLKLADDPNVSAVSREEVELRLAHALGLAQDLKQGEFAEKHGFVAVHSAGPVPPASEWHSVPRFCLRPLQEAEVKALVEQNRAWIERVRSCHVPRDNPRGPHGPSLLVSIAFRAEGVPIAVTAVGRDLPVLELQCAVAAGLDAKQPPVASGYRIFDRVYHFYP